MFMTGWPKKYMFACGGNSFSIRTRNEVFTLIDATRRSEQYVGETIEGDKRFRNGPPRGLHASHHPSSPENPE